MAKIEALDGASIHYREMGQGSRTLVLIHPWHTSGATWTLVQESLATQNRVIVVDLRGTGDSQAAPGPYTVEHYSQDLYNLSQSLELKDFVLVGHSMGGGIAQRFAVDHGELLSGLILLTSVPPTGLTLSPETQAFFRSAAGNRTQTEALWSGFIANPLPPETFKALVDSSMTVSPEASLESFDSWRQLNFAAEVRQIQTPTLVIAAAFDNPLTPDFLREKIVNLISSSCLSVIENTSHFVQLEQPKELVKLINEFVVKLG